MALQQAVHNMGNKEHEHCITASLRSDSDHINKVCGSMRFYVDRAEASPLRGLLGTGCSSSSSLLLLLSESESKSMAASDAAEAMAEGLRPAKAIDELRHAHESCKLLVLYAGCCNTRLYDGS